MALEDEHKLIHETPADSRNPLWYHTRMTTAPSNKKQTRTGLKLLPYFMCLLPILVINLGFRFLANIELYWEEREQSEIAQQELESLTRSSSFEYQLARHAGKFSDLLEAAVKANSNDAQLKQKLEQSCQSVFSSAFPHYKLHVFKKSTKNSSAELFFARTNKIESKRAMALIFDYLLDQHLGQTFSAETNKKKDKIAESYFGKTSRSESFATSQKGRTTYTLHEDVPHWFIWDFKEINGNGTWGYFVTSRIEEGSRGLARQLALDECRKRGNGLGGFVSLGNPDSPDVVFAELKNSRLFKEWLKNEILPIEANLDHWLKTGPPAIKQLGNYKIYSHLGKNSEHLSVFLVPMPAFRQTPAWIGLLNLIVISLVIMLSIRGLLLNQWLETGLTLRFLILYFLAATFPLGLLTITAVAYQYQSNRSSQNQIAANIEGCLRQFETRKIQIQEDYQGVARKLFADQELTNLIAKHGIKSDLVKKRIVSSFKDREDPLPLLGFFLLDLSGKGLEYFEEATANRLKDIFSIFKASIMKNLREQFSEKNHDVRLPEFKASQDETIGAEALSSVSGNDMAVEIEKMRNFCLVQKFGDGNATLIYNFLKIMGQNQAILFIAWDGKKLFEKSIKSTIENFKTSFPQFSFIAFRNTPQGLKTLFRAEGELEDHLFLSAAKAAETATARGGTVKEHLQSFSLVAMPFGQQSEIVIAGVASHKAVYAEERTRRLIFILLIIIALLIAVLCAYFTAAFLLKPITELKNALGQVSAGNYAIQLDSERLDELGDLKREFAQMVEGIKHRQRLAALLSDHAVEALSANDNASAVEYDAREFPGIALVTDIRSFTTLCETYPTDEITEMLNDHFAAMAAVISANGGRIYKFIGDAIEAVFDETDATTTAEIALKTAVEMHRAQQEINSKRAAGGKFTYNSGIGLARGKFYAGSVGSEDTRLDYSIIGETFSRAAQIEALTKKCKNFPIAFDQEIANLVKSRISVTSVNENAMEAMTIAAEDEWSSQAAENFSLISSRQINIENTQSQPQSQSQPARRSDSAGFFQKNFKPAALLIFLLFAIVTGSGIYQGFAIRNQSFRQFSQNQAQQQNLRLAKQIKTEGSAKVAFEMKMKKVIKAIEADLRFEHQQAEPDLIARHLARTVEELSKKGIVPGRVFAVSFNAAQPGIAFSLGIKSFHSELFLKLAHYLFNYLQQTGDQDIDKQMNPHMKALFGTNLSASYLRSENYGYSLPVKNGNSTELFYWNHITVYASDIAGNKLPEKNCRLAYGDKKQQRIAGMIMFSIPENLVLNNPDLLVTGYNDPGVELAIISSASKVCKSQNFPGELLPSNSRPALQNRDYMVSEEVFKINNEPHRLIIARLLPQNNQISLHLVTILLSVFIALLTIYVYRSLYATTALTCSIQFKLGFSIVLTAIIPLFTVAFVTDYFLTENQRATIQQQKLEIQRYLDTFELRLCYNEPITTRRLQNFARSPEIHLLAQQLDLTPDSKEIREKLRLKFAEFVRKIDDDAGWSSNITVREAILISRKNWEFNFSKNQNHGSGLFASMLNQVGKHLLAKLNSVSSSENLSMTDLKGEIYYDTALRSVRSNFGDDAYIKITNAISQMVAIEVTTGAAGLLISPLPSIEKPDYILTWMISIGRGGYLTRIAANNQGPFAVFSIENRNYGRLPDKFAPVCDLNLEKAAAWVSSSNLPVSFEQEIGSEKVSIEGRPGIQQIDNFLVGAAIQTPIKLATEAMRNDFHRFLLLAILIFLFIGYQTASDIVIPLRALIQGMHQVGLQNYFYRIATDRHDELGELCTSYDLFARGLAEKEIMGKMVSRSAQRAASENADNVQGFSSAKREFVFVFIGSPDFTARLSTENTEMLFKKLKTQVARLCHLIIEQGGDIDKLMGDKILGVFPVSSDNRAAACIAAINTVNKILQAEQSGLLDFPVAIGVNAGEVISGLLGFGAKRDFTVIGDAVNVTARIQKEAEKLPVDRCLFSEEFIRGFNDFTGFSLHSETALKGKSSTFKLYEYRPENKPL